jgi:hypothetical protein
MTPEQEHRESTARRPLEIRRFREASETLNVIAEIAPNDDMFHAGTDSYFESGRSALDCIQLAMLAAGKSDVRNVLDFPSGHGRSLRTLAEAFPEADFTACDLDRDGVDFCARMFGAQPIYSHEDPAQVEIQAKYDLIWSGSFFTHLDAHRFSGFLSLFDSLLEPNGLFVFTVHSAGLIESLRHRPTAPGEDEMLEAYEADGYGYYPYPGQNYGDALASPPWVTKQLEGLPGLRLVMYSIRAWHNYQDVVACVRHPT